MTEKLTHRMAKTGSTVTQLTCAALLLVTLVAHLGVLANPGFFSHDEWDKLEQMQALGLWQYVRAYGYVQAGPEFGYPVRPIGFIQQGLSSLWMRSAPILVHGFDVLLHAAIALLIFLALRDIGAQRLVPEIAGYAFALSPLTTGATGWMAASFDQWYTLFALLTCWAAIAILRGGVTAVRAAALLLSSAAAILNKEAAVVIPGVVAIAMIVWHRLAREDRFPLGRGLLILLLATLPILAYLTIRFPALLVSFGGSAHTAYSPSLGHVQANALAYFVFPFLPQTGEMRAPLPIEPRLLISVVLHLALVAGLVRYVSWLAAICYLAAYFLFLLPVLPLHQPAAHYIHGSALPMAAALGAVAAGGWRERNRLVLSVLGLAAAVMIFHLGVIQQRYYLDGMCQSTFMASLPARLASEPSLSGSVVLVAEAGSRNWTMRRALHDRVAYNGLNGKPLVRFDEDMPAGTLPTLRLRVTSYCEVR